MEKCLYTDRLVKKLDFEIPISLSSPHLLIPKSNLASGLWDISIDWEYDR